MINVADINLSLDHARALDLRMASEAKIEIALDQELGVDAAVRAMAGRATFPQRRMLEDKRPRLLAMAFSAGLVELRHSQPLFRFEDVFAVRVVALDTIHVAFDNRMMNG